MELHALSPIDGWAFVKEGERLWHLRPPYLRLNLRLAVEAELDSAVELHWYTRIEPPHVFSEWADLIAFLHDQVSETRAVSEDDGGEPPLGAGERALRVATPEILERFLNRIEHELLAYDQLPHAWRLLMAVMDTETLREDPDLRRRAEGVLRLLVSEERDREASMGGEELLASFPMISSEHGKAALIQFAKGASDRGHLLAAG